MLGNARSMSGQDTPPGPQKEGPTTSLHSCSVFLLDQNELVAKVFDGGVVDDEVRKDGRKGPGKQATFEGCL